MKLIGITCGLPHKSKDAEPVQLAHLIIYQAITIEKIWASYISVISQRSRKVASEGPIDLNSNFYSSSNTSK